MADLQIKITTTAEGQGAQEAAGQLDKLKTSASAAAAGSSDLSDDLKRQVEASKLTAAATAQTESSVRGLARGFQRLGQEIPIVGVAMRALLNPWTALAALIGIFVVKIKAAIAVQNELAQQSAELSLRLDPLIIRQVRTAQLQAELAEAARKHSRALAEQNTVLEANALAAAAAADAMGRRSDATSKILDAEKELALAKAGDDPQAKARIEAQFRAREETAKQLAAAGGIETAHRKLRETRAAAREAGVALPGARAAAIDAEQTAKAQKDQIEEQIKLAEAEEQAMEKEALAGERGEDVRGRAIIPGIVPGFVHVTARERARRGKQGMVEARQRIDALTGKLTGIQAPAEAAAARVTHLETQEKAARDALPGLEAAYQKAILDETARRQTAATVIALQNQAAAMKADAEAAEKAGKQAEKDSKRLIRALEEIIRIHGFQTDKVEEIARRSGSGG